jgi:CRISPR-associated protein Cas1
LVGSPKCPRCLLVGICFPDDPRFCLRLARALAVGKVRNCRVMLMRNHVSAPATTLRILKRMEHAAGRCDDLSSLLGIEGTAA